ncbi:MAG: hypothetical protein H7293_02905 [Candidatus Saccharibacteria bacterium]|nr:hypothetical protein [Rhodoferax sp.]
METLNANPLEFVNLTVTHLTERGVMQPGLLYEPPPVPHSAKPAVQLVDSSGAAIKYVALLF